ncbi:MAG: hypothetical protein ACMZ7B_01740 [Balneola sp.]
MRLAFIFFFLMFSGFNSWVDLNTLENIDIKIIDLECIDNTTSVINFSVKNNNEGSLRVNSDGFIFKGLFLDSGEEVSPRVMYDPIRFKSGDEIIVGFNEEATIEVVFHDLQYYKLDKDLSYLIEFEYLNSKKKLFKSTFERIPIKPKKTKICNT